jgi:hypothetical protein
MALDITYNWQINVLDCYPTASGETDVVSRAYYFLVAATGSYDVVAGGYQDLPLPSLTGSFIPFQDLTLETVVGWVEEQIGVEGIQNIKNDLASQLEVKINPPTERKKSPWLPPTE